MESTDPILAAFDNTLASNDPILSAFEEQSPTSQENAPIAKVGATMTKEDFADEPSRGATETAALNRQLETGTTAYTDIENAALRGAATFSANTGLANAADRFMANNAQELAQGVRKTFGGTIDLKSADADESNIDYMIDAMGANGWGGYLKRFLGLSGVRALRGDDNLIEQWEKSEGYKYSDPYEHKMAKLAWAQELASGMVGQREEAKINAKAELDGRDSSWLADVGTDVIEQGGYTFAYLAGALLPGGAATTYGIPLALATVQRAADLEGDSLKVDENGDVRVDKEGDSMKTAFGKGIAGAAGEVAIESAGGAITAKGLRMLANKTIGKIPVFKVVGGKMAQTAVGRSIDKYWRLMGHIGHMTGVQSFPEEYIEEAEQSLLDAALGVTRRDSELEGTTAMSRISEDMGEFFSADQQKRLVQSLLVMQFLQGGPAKVKDIYDSKYREFVKETTSKESGLHNVYTVKDKDGKNRNIEFVKGIDGLLADEVGVDQKELKYYTFEEKLDALDAWVNGLGEVKVKGWLDNSTKYSNELLKKMNDAGRYNVSAPNSDLANKDSLSLDKDFSAPVRTVDKLKREVERRVANVGDNYTITVDMWHDPSGIAGFSVRDNYNRILSATSLNEANAKANEMLADAKENNAKLDAINEMRKRVGSDAIVVTGPTFSALKQRVNQISAEYGWSNEDRNRIQSIINEGANSEGNNEAASENIGGQQFIFLPTSSIHNMDDVSRLFMHEGSMHGGFQTLFGEVKGDAKATAENAKRKEEFMKLMKEDSELTADEAVAYANERNFSGASPIDRLDRFLRDSWRKTTGLELPLSTREARAWAYDMRKSFDAQNDGSGKTFVGTGDKYEQSVKQAQERAVAKQKIQNKKAERHNEVARMFQNATLKSGQKALPYRVERNTWAAQKVITPQPTAEQLKGATERNFKESWDKDPATLLAALNEGAKDGTTILAEMKENARETENKVEEQTKKIETEAKDEELQKFKDLNAWMGTMSQTKHGKDVAMVTSKVRSALWDKYEGLKKDGYALDSWEIGETGTRRIAFKNQNGDFAFAMITPTGMGVTFDNEKTDEKKQSKAKKITFQELKKQYGVVANELVDAISNRNQDDMRAVDAKFNELAHSAVESGLQFPSMDSINKALDDATAEGRLGNSVEWLRDSLNKLSDWVEQENANNGAKGVRWSKSAPRGIQKQFGVDYLSATREEIDAVTKKVPGVRWSFKDEAKKLILKKRPDIGSAFSARQLGIDEEDDMSPSEWADKAAAKAAEEMSKFNNTKEQKAALHWFINGAIRLPEDAPKVTEAIKYANESPKRIEGYREVIANFDKTMAAAKENLAAQTNPIKIERAKQRIKNAQERYDEAMEKLPKSEGKSFEPFDYDSPMAMIDALHEFKPKAKPINPDKVPQLSDKCEMGNGVVTYLVQDDREGQQSMREIINTHWGEDANPWCLLHGDGHGHLSDGTNGGYDAWHYWNHYNALPKRVAFKDGKLLSFMATDRESHAGWIEFDGHQVDVNGYGEFDDVEWRDDDLDDLSDVFYRVASRAYSYYGGIDVERAIDETIQEYIDDGDEASANWLKKYRYRFKVGDEAIPEQWWDRLDHEHEGIPLGNMPVPGDAFGRWADFEIRDGEMKQIGGYRKGNLGESGYVEWYANGLKEAQIVKADEEYYDWENNGDLYRAKVNGVQYTFQDGVLQSVYTKVDGEDIYINVDEDLAPFDIEVGDEGNYSVGLDDDGNIAAYGESLDLEKKLQAAYDKLKPHIAEAERIYRENSQKKETRWSFIGKRGADRLGLTGRDEAIQMEKDGKSREEIWRATGWWKGPDKRWRVEVDVSKESAKEVTDYMLKHRSKLSDTFHIGGWGRHTYFRLEDVINNVSENARAEFQMLIDAYPQLGRKPIIMLKGDGAGGHSATDHIWLNKKWADDWKVFDEDYELASCLLHEIQHTIQNIEGFGSGGDGGTFSIPSDPMYRSAAREMVSEFKISGKKIGKELYYLLQKLAMMGNPNHHIYRGERGFVRDVMLVGYYRKNSIPWALNNLIAAANERYEKGLPPIDEKTALEKMDFYDKRSFFNKTKEDVYMRKYIKVGEIAKKYGFEDADELIDGILQDMLANNSYYRLTGEAESRLVETRMMHSEKWRMENPPWKDFDIDEESQVGGAQRSEPKTLPGMKSIPSVGGSGIANVVRWSKARAQQLIKDGDAMYYKTRTVDQNFMRLLTESAVQMIKMKGYLDKHEKALNLPKDIEGNTLFDNGSYNKSEEPTSICERTIPFEIVLDYTAKILKRPLKQLEAMYVNQHMGDIMEEPSCFYCYIALDRALRRETFGKYLDARDAMLKKFDEGMSLKKAYKFYVENFTTASKINDVKKARVDMWYEAWKNGDQMLTPNDLATDANIEKARKISESMNRQFEDAEEYNRGTSKAKKMIPYRAYDGHLLTMKQSTVDELNSHYGLRFYSFSDGSPAFVLEDMERIRDASIRGLKGLAYTKMLWWVDTFAPTNVNINISVKGTPDGKGGYMCDGMYGADWEGAKKRRDTFRNVGITYVAMTDDEVRWALAQDWVDTVIPFHTVFTPDRLPKYMGWDNHKMDQSDVKGKEWTKDNAKSVYPPEHKNLASEYFKKLSENNLEPRLASFMDEPNYMKLVNETRLSTEESLPLVPDFNTDAAYPALAKFEKKGGYGRLSGYDSKFYKSFARKLAKGIKAGEMPKPDPKYVIGEDGKKEVRWSKFQMHPIGAVYDNSAMPQPSPFVVEAANASEARDRAFEKMKSKGYKSFHADWYAVELPPENGIITGDDTEKDTTEGAKPLPGMRAKTGDRVVRKGNGAEGTDQNAAGDGNGRAVLENGEGSGETLDYDESFTELVDSGYSPRVAEGMVRRGVRLGRWSKRTTRLAPNGKRSKLTDKQYDMVRTPQFKAWFGDWEKNLNSRGNPDVGKMIDGTWEGSYVIDIETGEPLVVYHGGNDFNVFDNNRPTSRTTGIYASSDERVADTYYKEKTTALFMNVRRPFKVNANGASYESIPFHGGRFHVDDFVRAATGARWKGMSSDREALVDLMDGKFDGVFVYNVFDGGYDDAKKDYIKANEYIALSPNQIKSATDNNGNFSPTNPDIRWSKVTAEEDASYMDAVKRYGELLDEQSADYDRYDELASEIEKKTGEPYARIGMGDINRFGNDEFTKLHRKLKGVLPSEMDKLTAEYGSKIENDAVYYNAVKRGDMETARRMTESARKEAGYNTPKLYRGTSRFGYTRWNDGDIIFTTDSESRASGYGGPGNGNARGFSRSRNVSYRHKPFYGNNYDDLIRGAKEVLGADIHIVGNDELENARNNFRELFIKESGRIDDAQNKVKDWPDIPEEYRNDFEMVVWFFHNLLQDFDSFANGYGQMHIATRSFAESIMESRNRLRDAYERGNLPAEYNPIFDVMFKGYEYGDAIIDALCGYSRTGGDRDVHIANSKGEFVDADELGKEVDLYSGSGIMNLVGRLGNKPLIIDCNGAYWTNIKVDAIDGKLHSTDFIAKWARDNGYTSVILKNVMDPGIQNAEGSDYIFFNSNDVKSADPVTYDDAGNVIPLSERFNSEKDDIRWSKRSKFGPNDAARAMADFLKDAVGANEHANARAAKMRINEIAKWMNRYGNKSPDEVDFTARVAAAGSLSPKAIKEVFSDRTGLKAFFNRFREKVQDADLILKRLDELLGVTDKEKSAYYQRDRNYGMIEKYNDEFDRELYQPLVEAVAKLRKEYGDNAYDELKYALLALHGKERNRMIAERGATVKKLLSDKKIPLVMKGAIWAYINGTSNNLQDVLTQMAEMSGTFTAQDRDRLVKELSGSGASTAAWEAGLADLESKGFIRRDANGNVVGGKAKSAIDLMRQITQRTRDMLVQSGRLSQAQVDTWESLSPNYVPMRDNMDAEFSWLQKFLWGEQNDEAAYTKSYKDTEFKHAMGRSTIADDPIYFAIQQWQNAVSRSMDNVARRVLADEIRTSPKGVDVGTVFWMPDDQKKRELFSKHNGGTATIEEEREYDEMQNAYGALPMRRIIDGTGIVREVPDVQAIEQTYPNIIAFKEDGNLKFIRLGGFKVEDVVRNGKLSDSDANRIGSAVKKSYAKDLWSGWGKIRKATALFSALRTAYSPTFVLTNFLADRMQGYRNIYADFGGEGVAEFSKWQLKAFKAAKMIITGKFDNSEEGVLAKEWFDNGGKIGGMATSTFVEIERNFKRDLKDLENKAKGFKSAKELGTWLRSGSKLVENLNELVEMSTRLAAYATAKKVRGNIADAISYSRDITVNFNRKGEWTPIMNSLYAFSNASIQDIHRTGISLVARHGVGMVVGTAILGWILSALGYGQDDPEEEKQGKEQYKYRAEYMKQNQMGMRIGDHVWSVPIRGAMRLPFYLGEKIHEVMFGRTGIGSAAKDVVGLAVDSATDVIGAADSVLQSVTPSVARPLVEAAENKSFNGSKIARDPMNDLQVRSNMGRGNTGAIWKNLAWAMNRMTGGNDVRRGLIDAQPEWYQHIVNSIAGSLGRDLGQTASFVTDIANTAIEGTNRMNVKNTPFLSRMASRLGENSAKFHEIENEYKLNLKEFESLDRNQQTEFAKGVPFLARENRRWAKDLDALAKTANRLIKEEMRETDVDKREAIHQLRLRAQYLFINRMANDPRKDTTENRTYERRSTAEADRIVKRAKSARELDEKRRKRGVPFMPQN